MGRKTYNIDVYALFYMESYHVTHVIITKLNDLRAIRNKLNSFKNLHSLRSCKFVNSFNLFPNCTQNHLICLYKWCYRPHSLCYKSSYCTNNVCLFVSFHFDHFSHYKVVLYMFNCTRMIGTIPSTMR